MSGQPHASAPDQLRYLADIIRFRITLEQNRLDSPHASGVPPEPTEEEGEEPHRIYIADTNILFMYFEAERRASHMRPFPNLVGGARSIDQCMAVIAAEYVFSGKLPGQSPYPVYIAPEHFKEFQGSLSRIADDLKRQSALDDGQLRALKSRISRLRSAMKKDRDDPDKLIKLFNEKIPALIEHFNLGSIGGAALLHQLIRSDYVRPLRLAPFVDRALLDDGPDRKAVEDWNKRLSGFARSETRAVTETEEGGAQDGNRLRDARTLATIDQLNESVRARGIPARYVLLTTSDNILSAEAFRRHETGSSLSDSSVRTFRQFLPIINLMDIENAITDDQPFEQIRKAVDSILSIDVSDRIPGESWIQMLMRLDVMTRRYLRQNERFQTFASQEARYEKIVTDMRDNAMERATSRINLFRKIDFDRALTVLGEKWRYIAQHAIGVNAHHLMHHYDRYLGGLVDTFGTVTGDETRRRDLGSRYEQHLKTLSDSLTREHLRMSMRFELTALPADPAPHLRADLGARVPAGLPAKAARALRAVLDSITNREPEQADRKMTALTHGAGITNAQLALCAGLIAIRAGDFDSALTFAEQTRQLALPDEENVHCEALWLDGIARRTRVMARYDRLVQRGGETLVDRELDRAEKRQNEAHERFLRQEDATGAARSLAEKAWLASTRLIVSATRTADRRRRDVLSAMERAVLENVASTLGDVVALGRTDDQWLAPAGEEGPIHAILGAATLDAVLAIRAFGLELLPLRNKADEDAVTAFAATARRWPVPDDRLDRVKAMLFETGDVEAGDIPPETGPVFELELGLLRQCAANRA